MIVKRSLFEDQGGNVYRLLDLTERNGIGWAHVYPMNAPKPLPVQWDLAEFKAGCKQKLYTALPYAGTVAVTSRSPNKQDERTPSQACGDRRWNLIEPLIADERIYWRDERGKLVAKRAQETGSSKQTILAALRLYWSGGMTKDALIGRYDLSGIAKDERAAVEQAPRGRTPHNYKTFRWTPEVRRRVIKYLKKKRRARQSFNLIYRRILALYFSIPDQNNKKRQLPPGERPSKAQIRYIRKKLSTLEDSLRTKHGDDNFENNFAPKTGSARQYAGGVGQIFEIDATIPDVWIVSDEDLCTVIGKAVLYLVVDVYSRLIVGFNLTLDSPSWSGAMEALISLCEDKRKFCARWDLDYRKSDWVADGVWGELIRADRGTEMRCYASDSIAEGLETAITNTPRRKAPRKGTCECSFKLVHVPIKNHVAGYTPPSEIGKRQTDDRRGSATRTLKSLAQEIHEAINLSNSKAHLGMRLTKAEVFARVPPVPKLIWLHNCEQSMGLLTRYDEKFLRFKLLQKEDNFKVKTTGVEHKGLLWVPDKSLEMQWLLPATKGTFNVSATFDRRLVDVIYVHDKKHPHKWTTMHLAPSCSEYLGMSWGEYEALRYVESMTAAQADEDNLALEIQADEEAAARETEALRRKKSAEASRSSRPKEHAVSLRKAQAKRSRSRIPALPSTAQHDQSSTPQKQPLNIAAPTHATTSSSSGLQSLLALRKDHDTTGKRQPS